MLNSKRTFGFQECGFSLLEILISTALGVLLLLGMLEALTAIYKTYQLQQALNGMQENGRFAFHFLTQTIHEAGDYRCTTTKPKELSVIEGYSAQSVPAAWNIKARPGTDVLVIDRCTEFGGREQFMQTAYFIAKTSASSVHGEIIYGLFEKRWQKPQRELVSQVANMQVRYGLMFPGQADVDRYLSSQQVPDWRWVRSVEIALLFTSASPILTSVTPYQFAGKHYTGDHSLHREWPLYVALKARA